MTISPEMLAAYVDGELSDTDRQIAERAIAGDAQLQLQLARERSLRARLSAHFDPVAQAPVADHFRQLLDAGAADNIVSFAQARERRERKWYQPAWRNAAAIAATLMIGIALGHFGSLGIGGGEIASHSGALVAERSLAHALDTQLASLQSPRASVRIGVSFYNQTDQLCRSFENASLTGIACRQGDRWQIAYTAAITAQTPRTDYKQAGNANSVMMEVAQSMMKGDVLDARSEREALRR